MTRLDAIPQEMLTLYDMPRIELTDFSVASVYGAYYTQTERAPYRLLLCADHLDHIVSHGEWASRFRAEDTDTRMRRGIVGLCPGLLVYGETLLVKDIRRLNGVSYLIKE